MEKYKIAIYEMRDIEADTMAELAAHYGLDYAACPGPLTADTLPMAAGCLGVTTLGHSQLNAAMLERLAGLGVKYLSTRTIGTDHIDLAAAKALGLRVARASYNPHGVADFTVMLILLALRCYKPALWRQQVNDYSLHGLLGRELRSLTVGVVGTGKIGHTVAASLTGFGCQLLAFDPAPSQALRGIAEYKPLEELYANCDVITTHVPLTKATYHFINDEAIAKMKPGVVLVNTARGELMDIAALTRGIESGQIGALGLDVVENEAGIYHERHITDILQNRDMAYLRQFPNVVMTQHMAFFTREGIDSMARCGVQSLAAFMQTGHYEFEVV